MMERSAWLEGSWRRDDAGPGQGHVLTWTSERGFLQGVLSEGDVRLAISELVVDDDSVTFSITGSVARLEFRRVDASHGVLRVLPNSLSVTGQIPGIFEAYRVPFRLESRATTYLQREY